MVQKNQVLLLPWIQSQSSIFSSVLAWHGDLVYRKDQGFLPTLPLPALQSLGTSLVRGLEGGFLSNTWHFPMSQPL